MKPDWIKMTERAPTEADLPVWLQMPIKSIDYTERPATRGIVLAETARIMRANAQNATHWRPAKDDVPEPPREEDTQYEDDLRAYDVWRRSHPVVEYSYISTWHAALAYERAEVRKLMPGVSASWAYRDAIEQIRARCGGGGK